MGEYRRRPPQTGYVYQTRDAAIAMLVLTVADDGESFRGLLACSGCGYIGADETEVPRAAMTRRWRSARPLRELAE